MCHNGSLKDHETRNTIQLVVYLRLACPRSGESRLCLLRSCTQLGANFSNFDFEKLNRMNSNAFSALAVVLVFGFVDLSKGKLQKKIRRISDWSGREHAYFLKTKHSFIRKISSLKFKTCLELLLNTNSLVQ